MSLSSCPECGTPLGERAKRCSCGWFQIERKDPARTDHRCQYVIGKRRCPLPGSKSPSVNGSLWYCRGHCRALNDSKLGEAVLLDAEENYHQILENIRDWRKRLF
jgi:hypothetical protein